MKAVFILLAILAVAYAAPKNEEDPKNAGGEQEVNTKAKGEDNQTPAVPNDNDGKDNGGHSRRKRDTRDYSKYPQNDDTDSNYHPHNKFVKKGGILGAVKRLAQAILGVVGV